MNPILIKNYDAGAAVTKYRIVKIGAADNAVIHAAAATDQPIGLSAELDAVSGERVDVIHYGIGDCELGGTVTRGDRITSNATGQGVAAAPAAGTNNGVVGIALISGVSGDIIPVLVVPQQIQG